MSIPNGKLSVHLASAPDSAGMVAADDHRTSSDAADEAKLDWSTRPCFHIPSAAGFPEVMMVKRRRTQIEVASRYLSKKRVESDSDFEVHYTQDDTESMLGSGVVVGRDWVVADNCRFRGSWRGVQVMGRVLHTTPAVPEIQEEG